MKTLAVNVKEYFRPLEGQRPWRVRLGVGSFLTFDFGSKVKEDRHYRGEWHMWIYQATWSLRREESELANSDSRRSVIEVAVQRLENRELTSVIFNQETLVTEFKFGDFELSVSRAEYIDHPDDRDEYWLLYMPDGFVLSVGPGGPRVGPADR